MTISKNKKNLILSILILLIIFCIVLSPKTYSSVALCAIDVWCKILLPSIFPFFVFSKLLTSLGYVEKVSKVFSGLTYKLYKCPPISSYIFVMSIITGYPVGSKLTYDLYKQKQITKSQAKKIVTFTSNSGPMFILGSVGIGMLENKTCGIIIFVSHILSAVINGIILTKFLNKDDKKNENFENQIEVNNNTDFNLSSSVWDSIYSILLIGGIIIIAFIFIEILNNLKIFYPLLFLFEKIGINNDISLGIFNGIFEITKGCLSISKLQISMNLKTVISCGIITFGGFSTTLQAMAFLKPILSYKFFILQKITHTIISIIICAILCLFFM